MTMPKAILLLLSEDPERRDLLAPGLPDQGKPPARDDIDGRRDKESVHASFFSFLDFSLLDC